MDLEKKYSQVVGCLRNYNVNERKYSRRRNQGFRYSYKEYGKIEYESYLNDLK